MSKCLSITHRWTSVQDVWIDTCYRLTGFNRISVNSLWPQTDRQHKQCCFNVYIFLLLHFSCFGNTFFPQTVASIKHIDLKTRVATGCFLKTNLARKKNGDLQVPL